MENYSGLQFDEVKMQVSRYCSFSLGHQLVENLYPQFSKLPVKRELERLQQALKMTFMYGSMPFGGISDISGAVELAVKDATLSCQELLKIADHSYGVREVIQYTRNCQTEKDKVKELVDTLDSLEGIAEEITRCINRSGEVNDNASAALARIRRQVKTLQHSVNERLNSFMARNSSYVQDNIIAQRNDRSVILIKNNYRNTVEGLQYGSSASGQAVYVEPKEIIGVNNDLQNAKEEEKREVARILFALSQKVKGRGTQYLANIQTLGILDCLFARAQWAREFDAVVGDISNNMNLVIEKGRHPLIDQKSVVANSYHLEEPKRTILITGPNTGGKTVSLKLIGLFVVMHLSGMALPCKSASIPVYDNLFYDIGDNQSIIDDLSTFSAHIKNLARICREATNKSLVILDELGSGTDPVEGQAIANAVLDYFRNKQVYTVASTHYAKLKAYAKQYDDILLASVEFDRQNLKPTYRYIENTIGQSNALEIASRYGLPQQVVDKALEFKRADQSPEDILLENLQKELEMVSQQREQLTGELASVRMERAEVQASREKLENTREDILENARLEAQEIVEEAREESEEIIEELKQLKQYDINAVAKLKHQLDNVIEEVEEEEDESDEPIALGDYVRIAFTNQKGEVIALDKKNATVLCGGIKIRSSINNLSRTARPVEKKTTATRPKVSGPRNFKVELNLIGMRVEEALPVLDKFLDDALLARAPFVRVVHGVGSGALRSAVWQQLKKYKYISKYEYAEPSQGGSGATIVTFKE